MGQEKIVDVLKNLEKATKGNTASEWDVSVYCIKRKPSLCLFGIRHSRAY